MAVPPSSDSDFWNRWMYHISKNNAIPDIYSWHQIPDDTLQPDKVIVDWANMTETYGLPEKPIDINEYAWPENQNPAHTAWYLAQLERHNLRGLRAHWGRAGELHDTMAEVIFHNDGSYSPTGEWYLYEYYTKMEGSRVKTTASDNLLFDAFAVVSGGCGDRSLDCLTKLIAGSRNIADAYEVVVTGLSALGLPTDGPIKVRTLQFDWAGKTSDTGPPKDLGISDYTIVGDKVCIDPHGKIF
jgi:hypothetical protein